MMSDVCIQHSRSKSDRRICLSQFSIVLKSFYTLVSNHNRSIYIDGIERQHNNDDTVEMELISVISRRL